MRDMKRTGNMQRGFTLLELTIVLVVAGVLSSLGVVSIQKWVADERARTTVRQFADILSTTRAEAIRTRQVHVVVFGSPSDSDGSTVAALAYQDTNGDGGLSSGEQFAAVPIPSGGGLSWGHTHATKAAQGDPRATPGNPPPGHFTFSRPNGSVASQVAFFADGMPRAYLNNTSTGALGTGGGAVYATSGMKDFAVVLSPLGGVQLQSFGPGSGNWRH
jgi:prepilin-type N-terminal cleavage/methylation domain-containing protein